MHPIWAIARTNARPTIIVDVSETYNRIYKEMARVTPYQAHLVAHTAATMRTAWVFMGETNARLPFCYRTYGQDGDRIVDAVDQIFANMHEYANLIGLSTHHQGWVVWAGKPLLIQQWIEKLR